MILMKKEITYYIADARDAEILSYTMSELFDQIFYDYVQNNLGWFDVGASGFIKLYPNSALAKNLMDVLQGESDPKKLCKICICELAIYLNRMQRDHLLFSKDLEECQKYVKEIKIKPAYYG